MNDYGFTNCTFSISNEILSKRNFIVIKVVHKCICCDPYREVPIEVPDDYIIVRKSKIEGIRVKDCVRQMKNQGVQRHCNHQFLEGFEQVNETTFEACFGS